MKSWLGMKKDWKEKMCKREAAEGRLLSDLYRLPSLQHIFHRVEGGFLLT